MRKTIKEELEEKMLRSVLVNDNALIIYTPNEYDSNKVNMKVRYIKDYKIAEIYITTMTKEEFEHDRDNIIRFNKDKNAMAIFKKEDQEWNLIDKFYVEDYSFADGDFLEIEYKKCFPDQPFPYQFTKKEGKK